MMIALIDDRDADAGVPRERAGRLQASESGPDHQHFFRHRRGPLLHSRAMGTLFPAEASWLEIDAAALAHNASVFREVLGAGGRLGGVLKGNAYGHGFAEVLPLAHAACDALYVIEARDALAIRAFEGRSSAPRSEVLVLGAVDADEAVELARAQVDLALTDSGQARFVPALRAAGVRLRGHVHVDTGLGREGFSVDELLSALSWMAQARDAIEVAGVLSHFANTEDVSEQVHGGPPLPGGDADRGAADGVLRRLPALALLPGARAGERAKVRRARAGDDESRRHRRHAGGAGRRPDRGHPARPGRRRAGVRGPARGLGADHQLRDRHANRRAPSPHCDLRSAFPWRRLGRSVATSTRGARA